MNVDHTDRRLLSILQRHGRSTYQELGDAVGLSAPGAYQRVKRLEEGRVIAGYSARVDQAALGRPLLVLLDITRPAQKTEGHWRSATPGSIINLEMVDGGVVLVGRFESLDDLAAHVDALRGAGYQVRVRVARNGGVRAE